jgi:hypothetical protein
LRMIGMRLEMQRRNPLAMAVGLGQTGVDQRPPRFSIRARPMKQSFASLRWSLASGSLVEGASRSRREIRLPAPAEVD